MNLEGNAQSLLSFRVGPVLCCAPSLPVRSIITPPKLTHIAGSEPSQAGIFKHGSHIVKVLDLRLKFGVDPTQHTQPGNLIVTISEAGDFAFWVDQILDVFDFPAEGWGNLPPAIPRGIFSRTLLLNKKIHLYTEFEKLSTINDLGYLEHYIQQLTEKNTGTGTKQTDSEESKKTAIAKSTSKVLPEVKNTASDLVTEEPFIKTQTTENTTAFTAEKTNINKNKIETTANNTLLNNSSVTSQDIKPLSHTSLKTNELTASKKDNTPLHSSSSQTNVKSSLPAHNHINSARNTSSSATMNSVSKKAPVTPSKNTFEIKPQHQSTAYSSTNTVKDKAHNVSPTQQQSSAVSQPETDNNDDEQSSFGLLIFILILLLLPAAGIYYYLAEDTTRTYIYKKEQAIIDNEIAINANTIEKEIKIEKVKEANFKVESESEPVPENVELTKVDSTPITEVIKKEDAATNVNSEKTNEIKPSEYRADITQAENEITITIHQPDSEEKLLITEAEITEPEITPRPTEEMIKKETVIETSVIKPSLIETPRIATQVIDAPPVKMLQQDELGKPVLPKKIIKEITHVVVKGDTLWAIAKKYVKDPFLYPELARLSNIKNPHRIYPGNRVRIRFTKN